MGPFALEPLSIQVRRRGEGVNGYVTPKALKPGISLCVIVRNEAHFIGQCLAYVRELVSESVVVDTGSADATPGFAQDLGARVVSFPWRHDFSAARNFAIEQARHEWILVLDADEVIDEADHSQIKEALKFGDRCYRLPIRNYLFDDRHPLFSKCEGEYPEWEAAYPGYYLSEAVRLFPNREDLRFAGAHDDRVEVGSDFGITDLAVPIHHFGPVDRIKDRHRHNEEVELTSLSAESWKELHELGVLLNHSNDHSKAAAVFMRAIEVRPRDVLCWNGLGHALLRLGRLEEAEHALQSALMIEPVNSDTHCSLGFLYAITSKHEQAIAHLESALEDSPAHITALWRLGEVYNKINRPEEALNPLTRVLELTPHFVEARVALAEACIQLELWDAARAELEQVLSLTEEYSLAYLLLGEAACELGDTRTACGALRRYCELERAEPVQTAVAHPAAYSIECVEQRVSELEAKLRQ